MAPPPAAIEVEVKGVTDISSVVIPDPLTVNDVPHRRAKAPKMSGGVAAHASSDMFKSPSSFNKPKAKRWDHRINAESKSRKGSSLKSAAQYLKNPGMISLGGGLPSSEYFPFERLDVKVPTPPHFSEKETKESGKLMRTGKYDVGEGTGVYDLSISLNYGQATGSAQLLRFVTEHTEIVHDPPYSDWHCCLTAGSTSALDMAFRMFCTRGEYILSEEYTFATAVETAVPLGIKVAGVKMDEQGLLPDALDKLLTHWDPKNRDGAKKPWLLYTVPSGQNPTGATQGTERRKQIYKVAVKHDLYILEDEPYYFLQMQPYTGPNAPDVPPPDSHDAFIKALIPSYLSMDVDGRVLRLDSFSKVIAPGTRCGWIVGCEQIVERFIRHHEVSTQNPSGISQVVLFKLLDEAWGHGGYLDWLINLRLEYTKRRDIICHACETYLPKSIASWSPPAAGMFHWMKIQWHKHPHFHTDDFENLLSIEDSIFHAAIDRGVLVSRGSWFRAERGTDKEMFFRATFAAAPADKVDGAIKRFGDALRAEFQID